MWILLGVLAGAWLIWVYLNRGWERQIDKEWKAIRAWETGVKGRCPRLYDDLRHMGDWGKYRLWMRWTLEAKEIRDLTPEELYSRYRGMAVH